DLPTEAGGHVEHVVEARGVDIELLGNAAADNAGAANAELLDDGDPGAIGSGHAGRANAAGAGTDNDKIITIGHGRLPEQSSAYGDILDGTLHKERPRTRRGR